MLIALVLAATLMPTPEPSTTPEPSPTSLTPTSLTPTSEPSPTPEPSPTSLVCGEGTVPGWLGEDGLPTSCVENHPYITGHLGTDPSDVPIVTDGPGFVVELPAPGYVPVLTGPEVTSAPEAPADVAPVPTLAETGVREDLALALGLVLLVVGSFLVSLAFTKTRKATR